MSLLDHVTNDLEPFKIILARLGVAEPSSELRLELRQLIDAGQVVQEGQKKGAKYKRAPGRAVAPTIAPPQTPRNTPAPVENASTAPPRRVLAFTRKATSDQAVTAEPLDIVRIAVELPRPPAAKKVEAPASADWAWVEPEDIGSKLQELGPLHMAILNNWQDWVHTNGTVCNVGMVVLGYLRIYYPDLVEGLTLLQVSNHLAELARAGKLRVRRLLNPGKHDTANIYGVFSVSKEVVDDATAVGG